MSEAHDRDRTVEETTDRHPASALAGLVLLAMTLGGVPLTRADEGARQAEVTRAVEEALARAKALRDQAGSATQGAAPFAQAREQVRRAQALLAEMDEEVKDRRLVAALDEARGGRFKSE